jgi:hypothetical protein
VTCLDLQLLSAALTMMSLSLVVCSAALTQLGTRLIVDNSSLQVCCRPQGEQSRLLLKLGVCYLCCSC